MFVTPDGAGCVAAWINLAMFMPPPHLPNTLIKSNLKEERSGKKEGKYGMCQGLFVSPPPEGISRDMSVDMGEGDGENT